MQDYWMEVAPPTHITSAAQAGWESRGGSGDSEDFIEDGDQLAAALAGIPGGVISSS